MGEEERKGREREEKGEGKKREEGERGEGRREERESGKEEGSGR